MKMYIANCQICLLANAMKTCPLCKFNVGLEIKEKETESNVAQEKVHIVS